MWNKFSFILFAVTCFSIQLPCCAPETTDSQPSNMDSSLPPRDGPDSSLPPRDGPDSSLPPRDGPDGDGTHGPIDSKPGTTDSNPPPRDGPGDDGAQGQGPTDSKPISTGCDELDKCVKSLQDELKGKFVYNDPVCLAIHDALSCYDTAIKACDDYTDPFEGKTESFVTLRDNFKNYCNNTKATLIKCTGFKSCFDSVKLPETAKDLVDPMYWCAVGQAAVTCGTKETSESADCKSDQKHEVVKTELDKTCPSPVDVLKIMFGSKDNGVASERYNIMVILVTSALTIKMVY